MMSQFDEFVKVSSDTMSGNVPQHPVSQHHLLQHRRDAIAGRSMEDAQKEGPCDVQQQGYYVVCMFVA